MQDDPRHSRDQRRLDDEGPPPRQSREVPPPAEVTRAAVVRAVTELLCRDEMLERAGYRPGMDNPEELLNEIALQVRRDRVTLIRAVTELLCRDEMLERAGYRPGMDNPEELLNEITEYRDLRAQEDADTELLEVIDDARNDDDDPQEVLGGDRI